MHPKFWTPAEDKALRTALHEAKTPEEIERRVGRTYRACVHRCSALGWAPPGHASYGGLRSRADTWRERAEESARAAETGRASPARPSRGGPSARDFKEGESFPAPGDDRFTPPEDDEPSLEEDLEHLISVTRKPRGLEEVCDALDMSPKATRELIVVAQERGYRIELTGMQVGHRPTESPLAEQVVPLVRVDPAGDWRKFAAVGDIHAGSKHFMRSQFQDFVHTAYKDGVRNFLHVGDLLDGVYRHSVWEQSRRGFEEQVAEAIEVVPRLEGAYWDFIAGNHDETLGEASGLDVGRAIVQAFVAAGRNDFRYHGARGAYLRLKANDNERGLLVELWHPRDRANAYALSYRQQKKIEKYQPGQKPDILLTGHWHQSFYFETRGVHALSCGCFQGGQSSFGKSLGGAPSIGSWIVEYAMTTKGTVRRLKPAWIGYQEVETVRDVQLG